MPYSSLAQLLRPGFTRYQIAGGKSDSENLRNRPFVMQATLQHGINNTFTLYGGVTAFDDYQAYLLGSGINTGVGAIAIDVTQSRIVFNHRTDYGQSYRFTFNKLFTETDTNLVLAAYRYSTKDYYNINNALYAIDNDKRGVVDTLGREKMVLVTLLTKIYLKVTVEFISWGEFQVIGISQEQKNNIN